MTAGVVEEPGFKIIMVSSDEDGCRFYLDQYKPFRLTSLQVDAEAFGSTYAREIRFSDEEWLARVRNPSSVTFVVAVRSADDDDRVVASTSLIGPLPNRASNPYQVVSTSRDGESSIVNSSNNKPEGKENKPLQQHYQMAAVYTSPEARGRGLAKSLIKAATEEARKRAAAALSLSVVVYAENHAAISVYERCGFVKSADGPKLRYNPHKGSSASELEMYFVGSSPWSNNTHS
ncbi:hypothetical protein F5Y17DRAFT_441744 [Xylariaceae sp. FL0594]|nr:hypothetical protein F5Y17DRAFT_441744 [Xylariaceae sp. FL0594]